MTLNKILAFDAVTCALMGLVLTLGAGSLSALLGLPQGLLLAAGGLLFPIALFMAALALQSYPWTVGVWLVIIGNAGWVLASLVLLFVTDPNALGTGFVLIQAVVVACLGWAEAKAMGRDIALVS